ncbi:hypothetical protein [Microbacterium aurum]
MSVAGDSQSIAAALNHSARPTTRSEAFEVLVMAHGFGFVAPIWVGLVLAVAGFALALVNYALQERRPAAVPA